MGFLFLKKVSPPIQFHCACNLPRFLYTLSLIAGAFFFLLILFFLFTLLLKKFPTNPMGFWKAVKVLLVHHLEPEALTFS